MLQTLCQHVFCVAVYLPRRSDFRVDNMVEVFMNSIQQPEEEFLGIVLGVPLELKGALRHHVLQQITAGQTKTD